jgi:ribosome-associated protein
MTADGPDRENMSKQNAQTSSPSDSRSLAVELAQLAADTKCTNVRVLDMAGVSPVCDFMVLLTGTSPRQMRSVADEIADLIKSRGGKLFGDHRASGENWVALDLVDIVVHLFSHEARAHYDLDNLWGDAVDVAWKRTA